MIGLFKVKDKLGKRLVLILKGYPCSWGKCIFCPFAIEQSSNIREILEVNRSIIKKAVRLIGSEGYRRVAVFNGSSFHELPYDTAEKLAPIAYERVFEIEERPEYVTEDSVKFLYRSYLPAKLIIRVGFEVFDKSLRNNYLRKGIPDSEIFRLSSLRNALRKEEVPAEIWTYVLFGIEGLPEEAVIESVKRFKELLDGVIAVKYHKYLLHHPEERPVSEGLRKILEENADLVDWGNEEWLIVGKQFRNA